MIVGETNAHAEQEGPAKKLAISFSGGTEGVCGDAGHDEHPSLAAGPSLLELGSLFQR